MSILLAQKVEGTVPYVLYDVRIAHRTHADSAYHMTFELGIKMSLLRLCLFLVTVAAAYAAVNRDPDLIPKNEKSPLDHLGPIRAGKSNRRWSNLACTST